MFPVELPMLAIRQLSRFALGTDRDPGRAALALWELVGFGLSKGFPNAAYLADSPPITTDPMVVQLAEATDERLAALAPEYEILIQALIGKLVKWAITKLGL